MNGGEIAINAKDCDISVGNIGIWYNAYPGFPLVLQPQQ